MVVRLLLEASTELLEDRIQLLAKEARRQALVTFRKNSYPQEMHVIGHEAVNRTTERVAKGGVREDFAELVAEDGNQPVRRSPIVMDQWT